MSIYGSSSSWGDQCTSAEQSPINLSQSSSKPCDLLCELTFDDAYISQANVIVSNEGLILQSQTGLGSCKFAGESYSCQTLLVTHPSHHTIENIQASSKWVIFGFMVLGQLMESEIRSQPEILRAAAPRYLSQLKEALDGEKFEMVLLAARGSSDNAALYARYLIEIHLGIPVSLAAPSVLTRYGSEIKYPKCLAIGVSQSGAAPDVAEVLARLRAQG
jgi:hypothetical protein